jgi:hypothetical protein
MVLTEPWRAASGCAVADEGCLLAMDKAPFRLLAIVYRPDLRIVAEDDTAIGGEGRFVFQLVGPTVGLRVAGGPLEVLDPTPKPQKFTVIFEYSLPVKKNEDTLDWANRWHALGALSFGDDYNRALRAITTDFAGPDAGDRRPNGSALNQLRTNEVATQGQRRFGAEAPLSPPQFWELREFRLGQGTGGLVQHTVNLEPSREFDIARPLFPTPLGTRAPELASFLVANGPAVLASTHAIPPAMLGNSALVGSAPYGAWGKVSNAGLHSLVTAEGVRVDDAVRDSFAVQTCAGCHRHETGTPHFMHLSDRRAIDAVDQTTLGLPPVTDDTSARAIVLSGFLEREIAAPSGETAAGPRYADFAELLGTDPKTLRGSRGRRPCR